MRYSVNTLEAPKSAMLRVFGAITLTLALLLGVGASARAQSVCRTHTEVVKQLASQHSETLVAIELAGSGGVVEVFSTGDGSTWTMVITTPDGMTCMMATGEAWESLAKTAPGQET